MADDADKKGKSPPDPKAGKISHDGRGNAVWQWGSGTIRQTLDSTSKMLKRLEVPGLSLLDDPKAEDAPKADPLEALKAQREAGFDPYEGRRGDAAPQQKPTTHPAAARPQPAARPAPKPAATARPPVAPVRQPDPPAKKPSFLGKLFGKDRDR